MAKKKKDKNIPQNASFGKTEGVVPTTIDQLLGDVGQSNYRFLKDPFSEDQYDSYLRALLPTDLYRHAQEHGFAYAENRDLILRKLIDKFRLNRAQYKSYKQERSPNNDLNKLDPEMQKFLAGAR
jgi:hypothetical protein